MMKNLLRLIKRFYYKRQLKNRSARLNELIKTLSVLRDTADHIDNEVRLIHLEVRNINAKFAATQQPLKPNVVPLRSMQ